jgi:hypothetical protein
MSAERTTREASSASSLEVKMLALAGRNSTMERRDRFQLLQMVSISSGRKSPSLRYQYCFMPAKIRTIIQQEILSFVFMSKEDIAFRKMALLLNATRKARRQDELLEELKASAFEVLLLNPGCTLDTWAAILERQYGTELVDAFGTQPSKIRQSLMALWGKPYTDPASGLRHTFGHWAKALATEESIGMYYDLTKRKKDIHTDT